MSMSSVPFGETFPAVFVAEPDGPPARVAVARDEDLGEGDVLLEVAWSALNYKDGLALTGASPVVRHFPLIGGIDAAGRVVATESTRFSPGDEVVVCGHGIGEDHPGGYSRYLRVPVDWCEPVPERLSLRNAAAIGTAGFTAMLALLALERGGATPRNLSDLPLVVTGATGGVGSFAVRFASRLGYRVVASTGKPHEEAYLQMLGASEVIDRSELEELGSGPLGRVRFGAGIDTVGGATLVNIVRTTRPDGVVAACGLAGGTGLSLTVMPFILRGVTLAGINSVHPAPERRRTAWRRIDDLASPDEIDALCKEVSLPGVIAEAAQILIGNIRGRVVVRVEGD